MSYFFGRGKFQKLFLGLLIKLKNFFFVLSSILNFFLTYIRIVFGFSGPKWANLESQGKGS